MSSYSKSSYYFKLQKGQTTLKIRKKKSQLQQRKKKMDALVSDQEVTKEQGGREHPEVSYGRHHELFITDVLQHFLDII